MSGGLAGRTAVATGAGRGIARAIVERFLDALTRQMALYYDPHSIRVNCVCHGFVESGMMWAYIDGHDDPAAVERELNRIHPLGRVGRPPEVAAAPAFLASDDALFITGASLRVDGGLLAH